MDKPVTPRGIDHLVLNVRDMEESHRFWTEIVGLPALDGVVERLKRGSAIRSARSRAAARRSSPMATCWVEPYAGDRLEENLNPIGRMYYAASAMACTPNSLSQEVGLGLGAQAGEERLRKVAREAGFSNLRRASQTPVNLILELTPV
jgi:Glyoxalase/Bleomycin resistance protein/Dioxygenase superfamily